MNIAERTAELLTERPMTRFEIECTLGVGQQRVSEALRRINAHVVGHVPPARQGQPAPLYALSDTADVRPDFGALASAWRV